MAALRSIGGTAEIYELSSSDGDGAALKVLAARLQGRVDLVSRMLDEGRRLATVRDESVVTWLDSGALAGGRPYLITELLRGATLRAYLRAAGRLPPGEAAAIVRTLLRALEAVHGVGLVHCDVKLDNVFRCRDGRVKLLDLGAAEPIDAPPTGGALPRLATPRYMAPEQRAGAPLDPRTDLYAVGLLTFELLAGELAPQPDGDAPVGPRLAAAGIDRLPAPAAALVRRATAIPPADRYPSASAMAREVAGWDR